MVKQLPTNCLSVFGHFVELALKRLNKQSTIYVLKNSLWEKLLRINFDYKLNLAKRIEGICKKTSRKLNAIARLAPYMTSLKKSILINATTVP